MVIGRAAGGRGVLHTPARRQPDYLYGTLGMKRVQALHPYIPHRRAICHGLAPSHSSLAVGGPTLEFTPTTLPARPHAYLLEQSR